MSFFALPPSSIAFPGGLWQSQASPPLATKSTLHTAQILIQHLSQHVTCVYVRGPPGLWSPWTPEAVPRSCPFSLSASTLVGSQEICPNEGEFRQNLFQRGLWFSALCLARPASIQLSFLSRSCIIFANIMAWNLRLFQLRLSSRRNRCSETPEGEKKKAIQSQKTSWENNEGPDY